MRAVLDANVIISALLSSSGPPAKLLGAWQEGAFELVVSPLLLAELQRALAYPKLRRRIRAEEASAVLDWLRRVATLAVDPDAPASISSPDPGDDYLLALAAEENALLVSGDDHLLSLRSPAFDHLPIDSPAAFLLRLEGQR